jgi:DNA invertase Pin-like site-specific DNA recombinase
MRAAAIYVRISSDPEAKRAGVRRQIEDCKAWAARTGATVAEIYEDNDLSAFRAKPRPGYRQMCEDIKSGHRDGVITYHLDRLHRSPIELEEFIALIEANQVQVVTVTGGDYDLSTSDGRAMARVVGAFARKESEDKSRRITRQQLQQAKEGRRSGGGTRGYGYSPDHSRVITKEAAVIREAADRILAGDTLRSICTDLIERGVPTVKGGPWTQTVLRTILMSARISGQREHYGEIVATGDWPAIITPAQTARLRATLGDPHRRTLRAPRSYPLTGLVRCEICGAKMVARPRSDGRRRYVCAKGPGLPGCGGTAVLAEPLEEMIAEGVLHRIDTPDLQRAVSTEAGQDAEAEALARDLADDRQQLEDLGAMWGRKELSRTEWAAARTPILQRIEDSQRRLSRMTHSSALEAFIGDSGALRRQWADLAPARQRAIVGALLNHVTIGPAVRGRNSFDPSRVGADWKV